MKLLVTIIIITFSLSSRGQEIKFGEYIDSFGGHIDIRKDSTFSYTWRMDLMSSWTNGKWKISNDTISFMQILVYDTLSMNSKDSLVASIDNQSTRISQKHYAMYSLGTGGQNNYKMPNKLFYKKKKLYLILKNGEIDLEKRQGGMTSTKFNTWFSCTK